MWRAHTGLHVEDRVLLLHPRSSGRAGTSLLLLPLSLYMRRGAHVGATEARPRCVGVVTAEVTTSASDPRLCGRNRAPASASTMSSRRTTHGIYFRTMVLMSYIDAP